MNDLVWLLSQLTDVNGKILINGISGQVAELTDAECLLYDNIEFDLNEFRSDIGVQKLTSDCHKEILMRRWRYPSLSIHGLKSLKFFTYENKILKYSMHFSLGRIFN
jgi:hypothetical protein